MKNYNRCILLLILPLLAGCQNFLNVKPRNIKVVQSVEDLSGYPGQLCPIY